MSHLDPTDEEGVAALLELSLRNHVSGKAISWPEFFARKNAKKALRAIRKLPWAYARMIELMGEPPTMEA